MTDTPEPVYTEEEFNKIRKDWLTWCGARGGKAKGWKKRRGTPEYYRELAYKRVASMGQKRST
jgi:hypothetical protein